MSKSVTLLIDGYAMLFRNFFAIPAHIQTKEGLPTNALYGMINSLDKVIERFSISRAVVALDSPGATFREEIYSEYKGNRPPMDPRLKAQIPYLKEVVEALGFQCYEMPGLEADDLIGCLAESSKGLDEEVVIVSPDKDFAQLVDEKVILFDPAKEKFYRTKEIVDRYGIAPEFFVDYQSLVGDSVDNIPGVPGIGPKTAQKLLNEYQTLDNLLEHLDDLKGSVQKKLIEHQEKARLSYRLATILRSSKEVDFSWRSYEGIDKEKLGEICQRLEFRSLMKKFELDGGEESPLKKGGKLHLVSSLTSLVEWMKRCKDWSQVGVWIEWPKGWHPRKKDPIALAIGDGQQFFSMSYKDLIGDESLGEWWDLLLKARLEVNVFGQKALFYLAHRLGLEWDYEEYFLHDLMLASFIKDSQRALPHSLERVVLTYGEQSFCSEERWKEQRDLWEWNFEGESLEEEKQLQSLPYFEKVAWVLHLRESLGGEIDRESWGFESSIQPLLIEMELKGMPVDWEKLEELNEEFSAKAKSAQERAYSIAGREFNLNSPKQLGTVLFEELKLPAKKKTKSGQFSTNAKILEELALEYEIAAVILDYRKWAKLVSTYTSGLAQEKDPESGKLHFWIHQTTTATGRLNTTNPDVQTTPVRSEDGRRIREVFVADPGWEFISADWSQVELRIMAHFSEDKALLEAFMAGGDIHLETACTLFGLMPGLVTRQQREIAKTVNFATIYGQSSYSLGQSLGIPVAKAKSYIADYFEIFSGVRSWLDEQIERAKREGGARTLLGRYRSIPELTSKNRMVREHGERVATNTPIQGTAADICKLAMKKIFGELKSKKLGAHLLCQIHDELLFQCPKEELSETVCVIREGMENAIELRVPLRVDLGTGQSWSEAH